jgi:hypothetical protein
VETEDQSRRYIASISHQIQQLTPVLSLFTRECSSHLASMTSKSKGRGHPTKKSKRNISGLKNQPSSVASEHASSSSSAAASQPQSHPPSPLDLPSDSLEQFNETTRVDWEKEDLSINSEADSEDDDLPDTFEDEELGKILERMARQEGEDGEWILSSQLRDQKCQEQSQKGSQSCFYTSMLMAHGFKSDPRNTTSHWVTMESCHAHNDKLTRDGSDSSS